MFTKPKPAPVSFSQILNGFQEAINSVQDMLQKKQLDNLQAFFEADGKPVSQTVQIDGKRIDVPLINVVPHSNLVMDDVEIKFKTKVGAVSTAGSSTLQTIGGGELSGADLQLQMDGINPKDKDVMEVTIRFKAKEPPEGVSRLLDHYNKKL